MFTDIYNPTVTSKVSQWWYSHSTKVNGGCATALAGSEFFLYLSLEEPTGQFKQMKLPCFKVQEACFNHHADSAHILKEVNSTILSSSVPTYILLFCSDVYNLEGLILSILYFMYERRHLKLSLFPHYKNTQLTAGSHFNSIPTALCFTSCLYLAHSKHPPNLSFSLLSNQGIRIRDIKQRWWTRLWNLELEQM